MQSSNPVFARSEGFNGRRTSTSGVTYPGYSDPSSWGTGSPQSPQTYAPERVSGPMTIDSVVQKTGITLGVVVLVAAATWFLTGDPTVDQNALSGLYMLSMVGALGGLALSLVNSFKRVISPALVIAYAALEGLFIGAFSKAMEASFGGGLVVGAVLGTMAAVGGTLAAYKFFNIQVGTKFRKWVVAAMFGFVALALLDFVLAFFGASFGFNGFGPMGLLSSVIGLGLGVLLLILDFDFVERGIAARLPEQESWRAAFGLTVTIIWIYIELLRILAILRGND
ncbi:MAG TPA: Bax inhibitor-1/YccA family protein [Nocardioidaceae bacterium]|nr:Bax inhibitor-1/YccA family protein [Nocardioidaceae bacterium]